MKETNQFLPPDTKVVVGADANGFFLAVAGNGEEPAFVKFDSSKIAAVREQTVTKDETTLKMTK
jgi:hypothetical protein